MSGSNHSQQSIVLNLVDQIHNRAIDLSTKYKRVEAELIDVLQLVDQHRVFLEKGHSSLFTYGVNELGLSESVAYNLISVSRKAREVPELKEAIEAGALSLSNARKIAPVLTLENKNEWIEKASKLSQRQLEKEIVKVHPRVATPEKVSYVTESRVQINFGLSETEMIKLRRVQDLLSQSRRKSVSLEEVLMELAGDYLHRYDPVEKAKRIIVKKGNQHNSTVQPVSMQAETLQKELITEPIDLVVNESKSRTPIPASVLHQVNLRDRGRCTHLNQQGTRCNQTRFLDIHHRIPVSRGGQNALENLITLCSTHHRFVYRQF